ncbi:tRNA (adenosine(37)-N6)-threonylcarbamoyltransferase complex ATPase subunit type 1 TsaE [Marinibaculum pumilum]|uniref:tRNA threonylcarbamoyladenosine biosynthesis protein TsaE n=1 Tax=Marinibaculum pumilum TaxID=1766165 RepID=A0ABV7L0H1_9PROT
MTAPGRSLPPDRQPADRQPTDRQAAGRRPGDLAGAPALLERHVRTPAETAALGAALAAIARPGDLFCLQGGLGSGKTVLARGFVRALAGAGIEVPSPTFNIVLTYPAAAATLWHFDLYRVADADELWELGLEEAFADGISLVEWPERLGDAAPAQALWLELRPVTGAAGPPVVAPDSMDGGNTGGDGMAAELRQIIVRGGAAWAARLREAGLV